MKYIGIECECLEGPTWGMGRQVRKLIEFLSARSDLRGRFKFILYSNNPLPDDSLYNNDIFIKRPCGIRSILGSWAPSSFAIHYFILLPLRLIFDRPSMMYFPNYMLPIGTTVKSLVMLTDDIFTEAKNPDLGLRYRIPYQIYAIFWARKYATNIMAISHSSAKTLNRKGIEIDRIVVNEMGITKPLDSKTHVSPIDFLFVGQAFPRRKLRESLEAFIEIEKANPGLTFRFIGRDKYPTPTIEPLICEINRTLGRQAVTSTEYVSDDELAASYRKAKAVVYVSDVEGFGMPPLEALSYGTVPVVSDAPVNREIYGNNAFFVPIPITKQGIESAMRRALYDTNSRERIIRAGADIVARYSWQAHADRFMNIVEQMTT